MLLLREEVSWAFFCTTFTQTNQKSGMRLDTCTPKMLPVVTPRPTLFAYAKQLRTNERAIWWHFYFIICAAINRMNRQKNLNQFREVRENQFITYSDNTGQRTLAQSDFESIFSTSSASFCSCKPLIDKRTKQGSLYFLLWKRSLKNTFLFV